MFSNMAQIQFKHFGLPVDDSIRRNTTLSLPLSTCGRGRVRGQPRRRLNDSTLNAVKPVPSFALQTQRAPHLDPLPQGERRRR